MAKGRRTRKSGARDAATPGDAETGAAGVPVIVIPAGGTLDVAVDVGPMAVPYTVAYAGRTLIKSLVDSAEPVPLESGDVLLTWAFAHAVKGWSHRIGYSINGGPVQMLEERSDARKDPDHSVGLALVQTQRRTA